MDISIVGTGYVGLVSGACLAEKGHHVVCVDVHQDRVDEINGGTSPIYEEGLHDLISSNIGKRLTATTDISAAIHGSEVTLIAVGTPFDGETIDLAFVREAAKQTGNAISQKSDYHAVVVKSTVVPGTTDRVVGPILEEASGRQLGEALGLGVNPEFLTEGTAVRDFMDPDRIVIGGADKKTLAVLEEMYASFSGTKLIRTGNSTAEMIKYASNSLLATMISFSNELANLCTEVGDVDIVDVMNGVHASHYLTVELNGSRRTAPIASFLEAGCGFGGSCLPKDVQALVAQGKKLGQPMFLLDAVININRDQHTQVVSRLLKHFVKLEGLRIGILGLAFKPDTDDVRESPAIPIIRALKQRGAEVKAYDPVATENMKLVLGDTVDYCESLEEVVAADALVLVTRWDEFQRLPEVLSTLKQEPLIIDGRRVLDKSKFLRYEGIGL